MADTIKMVVDQLSRIFRHLIPGVVIVVVARIAHPDWFGKVHLSDKLHLVVLAVVSIAVGNVWYVCHRYIIHQFFDFVFFCCRTRCPCCKGEEKDKGYFSWLSKFLIESFDASEKKSKQENKIMEHLHLRSTQIILMYIVSEVVFIFSVDPFSAQPGSEFTTYQPALMWAAVGIFSFAVIQQCVSEALDRRIVKKIRDEEQEKARALRRELEMTGGS